jgi:TonB family protein
LVILFVAAGQAASPPSIIDDRLVASGKIDIRPPYPSEALSQHLTGSGVFVLHVDPKSGAVSSVQVEQTTGHKVLDDASVDAFRNLRFKPRGFSRVTIPVTFEIPPDNSGPRVTRNFPATWLAVSQRPQIPNGRSIGRR